MTDKQTSPESECASMCKTNPSKEACERLCKANGVGKCMAHLSEMYELTDPPGAYFNTDTSDSKFCRKLESLSDQFHEEDWAKKSKCSKSLTHVMLTGVKPDLSAPESRRNFFRDFCQVSMQ